MLSNVPDVTETAMKKIKTDKRGCFITTTIISISIDSQYAGKTM